MNSDELNRKITNGESFIIANDGQYLGKLCLNIFDTESILNVYGLYGNQFSTVSINNKYSMYGSQFSSLSPYNPYTTTPPIIYLRGRRYGFLSVNPFLKSSVNPGQINEWMKYNNLYY